MKLEEYPFPKEVLWVLEILNQESLGFLVGGSVRDILLGKEPKDFDFATNMSYEKGKEIFQEYSCIEVGKSFGVLRIRVEDKEFEIAKFRKDIGSDGRRPKEVAYVETIEEDLARRDFSINAMAYHLERGLIDLYGGQKDLEERRIRFLGDAEERIEEDGLRILRAFRFQSQLGFSLEENTKEAIHKKKAMLERVTNFRKGEEFHKILEGDFVELALEEMRAVGVLSALFPELEKECSAQTWKELLKILSRSPRERSLRAAIFFFGFFQKDTSVVAKMLRTSLGESKKQIDRIRFLMENRGTFDVELSFKDWKRLVYQFGKERLLCLLRFEMSYDEEKQSLLPVLEGIKEEELAINGFDLIECGISRKKIPYWKNRMLEKIWEGSIKNEREALISEVKKESYCFFEKNKL